MVPHKLNILVVEDNDDDLFLVRSYLSDIVTLDLVVDTEVNYEKGRHKILENRHDIYIIDYLLGAETGLELIRECVKAGINKPFILLTGRGDKKIDMEAAKAGAFDYLTKADLNSELLERSLRYSVERYKAYEAIAESELRYREIFTRSNDIIFVLDESLSVVNFNPMMPLLLHFAPEELIYKPFASFFANASEGEHFANQIKHADVTSNVEIVLETKTGEVKTFLVSCTRINSTSGGTKYQGILYDYTNLKKSYNEQLAKERIDSMHRLVRSLAHEIRNPLTNIDLSILQLQNNTGEDMQLFLDIIKRNSKRINDLIGDLMGLSKPSKSKYGSVEIRSVLKLALAEATDRIKLKQIRILEKFETQDLVIWGDVETMKMALLNIIINAVEAVEPEVGQLTIETVDANEEVLIKISDNGPGIADENLTQLFQPYFTKKKNGMGLGLATTHSVIQAHEGKIEVSSKWGEGTTFIVKLKANRLLKQN